ncbi:MAG: gfo/Idh/MocA family oxidoreductase, partial [Candidatus Latescibacterota bacterium]
YRFGDIFIPRLDDSEPLKVECQHFVDCVENKSKPRSSGMHGYEVVKVLETAMESIRQGGKMIAVDTIQSPTS